MSHHNVHNSGGVTQTEPLATIYQKWRQICHKVVQQRTKDLMEYLKMTLAVIINLLLHLKVTDV